MDQNSGNMIIGRQEIQHKDQRKDTMDPLNTDGSRILHTKNRNCRMVGTLEYCQYTEYSQDDQNRLHSFSGVTKVDTKICSSCGTKKGKDDGKISLRDDFQLVEPDHLLWPATRKVNDIRTFLEVDDFDSD